MNIKICKTILILFPAMHCGVTIESGQDNFNNVYYSGDCVAQIDKKLNIPAFSDKTKFVRWVIDYIVNDCIFYIQPQIEDIGRLTKLTQMKKYKYFDEQQECLVFIEKDGIKYLSSGFAKKHTDGKYHFTQLATSPWKIDGIEGKCSLTEKALVRDLGIIIHSSFFKHFEVECMATCSWILPRLDTPLAEKLRGKKVIDLILSIITIQCAYQASKDKQIVGKRVYAKLYNMLTSMQVKEMLPKFTFADVVGDDESVIIAEPTDIATNPPINEASPSSLIFEAKQSTTSYKLSMLIPVMLIIYYIISCLYPSILLFSHKTTLFLILNIIIFELLNRMIIQSLLSSKKYNTKIIYGIIMLISSMYYIYYDINLLIFYLNEYLCIIIFPYIVLCSDNIAIFIILTLIIIYCYYIYKLLSTEEFKEINKGYFVGIFIIIIDFAIYYLFQLKLTPITYFISDLISTTKWIGFVVSINCLISGVLYCISFLLFLFLFRKMNYADYAIMIALHFMIFSLNRYNMIVASIVRIIQYLLFTNFFCYCNEELYYEISSNQNNDQNTINELGGKRVFLLQLLFIFLKYAIAIYYMQIYFVIAFVIDDLPFYRSLINRIPLFIYYEDAIQFYRGLSILGLLSMFGTNDQQMNREQAETLSAWWEQLITSILTELFLLDRCKQESDHDSYALEC